MKKIIYMTKTIASCILKVIRAGRASFGKLTIFTGSSIFIAVNKRLYKICALNRVNIVVLLDPGETGMKFTRSS